MFRQVSRRLSFAKVPIKDRRPTHLAQREDGNRKLAVLINGKEVTPSTYIETIAPKLPQATQGTICVQRMFDYHLGSEDWQGALAADKRLEHFRVDSFIPIHMQMAADVGHIIELSGSNLISGVVMTVSKRHSHLYAEYFSRFKGFGVSVFVANEEDGVAFSMLEDPVKLRMFGDVSQSR